MCNCCQVEGFSITNSAMELNFNKRKNISKRIEMDTQKYY